LLRVVRSSRSRSTPSHGAASSHVSTTTRDRSDHLWAAGMTMSAVLVRAIHCQLMFGQRSDTDRGQTGS
jgi:hypothetical protein